MLKGKIILLLFVANEERRREEGVDDKANKSNGKEDRIGKQEGKEELAVVAGQQHDNVFDQELETMLKSLDQLPPNKLLLFLGIVFFITKSRKVQSH